MVWKPNRRWFRFSVRTLLVAVTFLCVWLGWQVSIVRERERLRERFKDSAKFREEDPYRPGDPPQLSWVRDTMGDRGIETIEYYNPETANALRAVFPEATFCGIISCGFSAEYIPLSEDEDFLVDDEDPFKAEVSLQDAIQKLMSSLELHTRSDEAAPQPQQSP